jgi:hypothetical protein
MVSRTRSVDGTAVKIDLQIVLEGCLHESGIVKARRGGQTGEGGCFPRRRAETTVGTISARCFLLDAKYGSPLSDLQRMQQPSLNPPALPAAPRSAASTCAKAMATMLEALLKSVDIILAMGHPARNIRRRLGRAGVGPNNNLTYSAVCTQSVSRKENG